MINSRVSSVSIKKILGCLIFDAALIVTFFKVFGLFIIIDPVKSVLIFITLLIGLMILNIEIVFSEMLFKITGIPHCAANVTLTVLYVIISNTISGFLISGSIVWYIVWQLIIFASFIFSFAAIATLSNTAAEDDLDSTVQ
ncbi:hypothetical protein [Clostridium sp.]|jgi:hypothetical protein|uniref:hypothetical protein n=1 Tax=Clostridium sp. TaxID=1506 RepID=UPI003EEA5BEB